RLVPWRATTGVIQSSYVSRLGCRLLLVMSPPTRVSHKDRFGPDDPENPASTLTIGYSVQKALCCSKPASKAIASTSSTRPVFHGWALIHPTIPGSTGGTPLK